jgi:PAS domain S-box-containing protein
MTKSLFTASKQKETAALDAEQTRALIDAVPLSCILTDRNLNILTCNKTAVELFKLSKKEDIQRLFDDLVPEYQPDGSNSKETAAKAIKKAFDEGYVFYADWTHRNMDGEIIPSEVTLVRVNYGGDQVIAAYTRDLRAVKEAEAKMREADERAHLMLEQAPLIALLWDNEFHLLDCNQEAVRIFGLSSKKEVMDRFFELLPEYQPNGMTTQELFQKAHTLIFKETEFARIELTMNHPVTGEGIPFDITLVRIKYKDEFSVLSYGLDLRERNAAIAKMREADKRAQIMFDIAPFAGCMFDKDINMIDCNEEMLRMCGSPDKEFFLQRHTEFIPEYQPDGALSAGVLVKNVRIALEKRYHHFEFMHQRGSGVPLPTEVTMVRVKYQGEHVIAGYFRDLTEQKAAESAFEAKNLFIANMNHEMRTPMNVIVGLTDLLLEEEDVPGAIKETLYKINMAGTTLMGLISDVLDISKVDAGKMELTPVQYDVASFLNDIITLNMIRIEEKPITFNLDISENLPRALYGDDLRVKQILNNLLSNAFKYTRAGTVTLGVDCKRDGDNVWTSFCVKDSGIGIRAEDIETLFTDYHQVDAKANRRIEGTGLGLSITKRFVELVEGEITVESEYGKGTTFKVRIRQEFVTDEPIGKEMAESLRRFRFSDDKKKAQKKLKRSDLSYARVLVVDDFPTNLDVAAGMLRKYKMQVDCVTNGQEAIELIVAGKPVYDAIFMDHMMPEMDGVEAVKRIRALNSEYAKNVPIIALTANAIVESEKMFLENSFNAFLSKPFNVMNLDSVVQRWVRQKENEK